MKKMDELSIAQTVEFAAACYLDKKTHIGGGLLDHCKSVARQAEVIANKLYQDLREECLAESAKDSIAAVVHCGLLHDVLNVSACAFENIAEVANVQVAAMVAALSRDYRLVETKRDMEFRGRLSQSPVAAQIVAVADIICTAKAILNALESKGLAAAPKSKKTLTQLDGDLMAVHAANKYYVLRMYVHAARNMLISVSQKIKDCKHQIKMEKLALQTAKTLRESKARGAKQVLAQAASTKKKGTGRGKKRSTRSNS